MVPVRRSVDPERVEPSYGILRSLPDANAPLEVLGTVLTTGSPCRQRRWLIDNRMADEPLGILDLARFLNLVTDHGEWLGDVVVACVAPARWGPLREQLAQQLPFPFRRFEKIDEALRWLEGQPDGRAVEGAAATSDQARGRSG